MATYSCEMKCMSWYGPNYDVCGTDGLTYTDPMQLHCIQEQEYGKRVNLQFKHDGPCWIWEKNGFETFTLFDVSKC